MTLQSYSTARAYGNLYSRVHAASQFPHSRVFFVRTFISVYYALASTRKDFTRRLASETSIFRLDLSAATRMYTKKGLADISFVIAVICVFTFQIIFHGGDLADKVRSAFKLLIGYLE